MSCSRAWAGVLASAVWVVSTTELVGVHAKGRGREDGLCRRTWTDAQRMEVEAKSECWGMGKREVGLLHL